MDPALCGEERHFDEDPSYDWSAGRLILYVPCIIHVWDLVVLQYVMTAI